VAAATTLRVRTCSSERGDDALQTTVDANARGVRNAGSQILLSTANLCAGQHTLQLVKKNGVSMLLDAFR
jgi:hypothetical protein